MRTKRTHSHQNSGDSFGCSAATACDSFAGDASGSDPTRLRWGAIAVACVVAALGCRRLPPLPLPPSAPMPIEVPVNNPSHVPNMDPQYLWEQVADSVDDYFSDFESEEPVRRRADRIQEGKLVTYPEISGTIFEPHRRETSGYEKLQSTFQTIRRTATVTVIPDATGYIIEVRVIKEQEDVDQSQFSAAGSAAQRHDGTIVRNENQLRQLPATLGWYEIGRDTALERKILARILGRIATRSN